MIAQGTVAAEIKSGYGLSLDSELKMLRVVKRLKEALPLQLKATLLAAHALPPSSKDDRAGIPGPDGERAAPRGGGEEGLADFVGRVLRDQLLHRGRTEQVLEAGAAHGLPERCVNQFTSIGGIQAAVAHAGR